jgi:hypothetical protein
VGARQHQSLLKKRDPYAKAIQLRKHPGALFAKGRVAHLFVTAYLAIRDSVVNPPVKYFFSCVYWELTCEDDPAALNTGRKMS